MFKHTLYFQLAEISIPHYLTASIFTAQSGDIAVFYRNVRLMLFLCFTAGICRLKSCMVKATSFWIAEFQCMLSILVVTDRDTNFYNLCIWLSSGLRGYCFGIANMVLVSFHHMIFIYNMQRFMRTPWANLVLLFASAGQADEGNIILFASFSGKELDGKKILRWGWCLHQVNHMVACFPFTPPKCHPFPQLF